MRKGIEVRLGPGDRERLEAVIGSGNSPLKHVWRARIALLSADGVGTMANQRQTGKGKPTIWRWQARFMAEGVDGLLHEAARPAGKPPLSAAVIERVVEMTLAEPPGERTHWTGRAMAKAAGVSHRSAQRIWAAHGLKPPGEDLQAVERPEVCRQGAGCRRPLKTQSPSSGPPLSGLQVEQIELPGRVIDVEAMIDEVAAVTIVHLSSHHVCKTHLLAAQRREWELQAALPLVSGVIDDHHVAAAILTCPGIGNKAVRCPVAEPGRLRLELRPNTVAKGAGIL
jgi:hypothetical protein